jgi:hypothetical protein
MRFQIADFRLQIPEFRLLIGGRDTAVGVASPIGNQSALGNLQSAIS